MDFDGFDLGMLWVECPNCEMTLCMIEMAAPESWSEFHSDYDLMRLMRYREWQLLGSCSCGASWGLPFPLEAE